MKLTKQKRKTEAEELDVLVRGCKQSYAEWDTLYLRGGNDPFWADGVNLGLVRNHIIPFRREIEKLCSHLPPEVPSDYMARADEIRVQAKQMLVRLKACADYEKLLDIEAFILELSDEKDERIPEKWNKVMEHSIFPKDGLGETVKSSIAIMPHKSIRAAYRCCMERDMSDLRTGLLPVQATDILNEIK